MIPKKKFYFIRHGRTDWNDRHLCQGTRDIPLNAQGRQEIFSLCPLIITLPISTVVSSPLVRAHESAKILLQHRHLPLVILDDLKERNWGEKEGISSEEMYRFEENEPINPGFGIEPISAFNERVLSGLKNALQYDCPLIVSHGRVFLSLTKMLGLTPIQQIPNGVVIECTPTSTSWSLTFRATKE
ncbi:MAG: histidine phosphatase family protein [Parachlamydiaceae bacterium]